MAREDVNIKVSANVAEAIRLWKAMEEGPKGMANELDALGAKGKKAATGMGGEFKNLIGQWGTIAAAILAAKKALDAYMASQQAAWTRQKDSTRTADAMSREIYNLADGKKALGTIRHDFLNLAQQRKVAPGQAKDAIGALLGAGYTYEQAVDQGGADAILRTLAATNATGKNVNVKELTDAITAHLSATGQDRTKENILGAGQSAQSMFASTKLEIQGFQAYAPRAKNIYDATGLRNEQIAIASQFADVTTDDVGATAFHSSVMRLQAGTSNSRIKKALKELGVNPEDVDFQGESFFDVQQRMGAAFDAAGPRAANLKQRIFGNEGLLGGNVLFTTQGAAQTQERLRLMANTAAFNQAANVTEGGLAGKAAAAEAAEVQANFQNDFVDPDIARRQLLTEMENQGVSRGRKAYAEWHFDRNMKWWGDAEYATRQASGYAGLGPKTTQSVVDAARAETIRIELTDQNGVTIPHKSNASGVGKNKAPKE